MHSHTYTHKHKYCKHNVCVVDGPPQGEMLCQQLGFEPNAHNTLEVEHMSSRASESERERAMERANIARKNLEDRRKYLHQAQHVRESWNRERVSMHAQDRATPRATPRQQNAIAIDISLVDRQLVFMNRASISALSKGATKHALKVNTTLITKNQNLRSQIAYAKQQVVTKSKQLQAQEDRNTQQQQSNTRIIHKQAHAIQLLREREGERGRDQQGEIGTMHQAREGQCIEHIERESSHGKYWVGPYGMEHIEVNIQGNPIMICTRKLRTLFKQHDVEHGLAWLATLPRDNQGLGQGKAWKLGLIPGKQGEPCKPHESMMFTRKKNKPLEFKPSRRNY